MSSGITLISRTAMYARVTCLALLASVLAMAQPADWAELAKKPGNPVAALISVPIQFHIDRGVGPAHRFGSQPVSIGVVARYRVDGPESAPHGWSMRVVATLLLPK